MRKEWGLCESWSSLLSTLRWPQRPLSKAEWKSPQKWSNVFTMQVEKLRPEVRKLFSAVSNIARFCWWSTVLQALCGVWGGGGQKGGKLGGKPSSWSYSPIQGKDQRTDSWPSTLDTGRKSQGSTNRDQLWGALKNPTAGRGDQQGDITAGISNKKFPHEEE